MQKRKGRERYQNVSKYEKEKKQKHDTERYKNFSKDKKTELTE